MSSIRRFLATTCVAMFVSTVAHASIVTVDFDTPPAGEALVTTDYIENGFRFSPNCHYDRSAGAGAGFGGTQWIGFDGASCSSQSNPAFRGPAGLDGPAIFVDNASGAFTLSSLWVALGNWTVQSSNGGFASFGSITNQTVALFSGAEWTNIDWLLFAMPIDPGLPRGFDHFVADVPAAVPEPASAALLLAGLAGLAIGRRRAAKQLR